MIQAFLRPFFGGIFLDRDLATSSRMMEFVFRMFSLGEAALPARGMSAIPSQIAASLPHGSVRTDAAVRAVSPDQVELESGERVVARAVVVAVEGPEAARLVPGLPSPRSCSTVCLYYDAPEPPVRGPLLVLDGDGQGPVNHLCVPSQVSPSYAPPGRALVSLSLVGDPGWPDADLDASARRQMGDWFGSQVASWTLLRIYRIHHALPAQPPGWLDPPERPVRTASGLFVCGDHRDQGSLQGAMVSGRRAAEAVLAKIA